MFQHLDDPAPLPPSTREQRQATLRRGESLRRRRRARIVAAAAAVAVIVGALAWSPGLRGTALDPPVVASPPPSVQPTATVGPGRGSGVFWGSSPEVSATFTMPAGWQTEDGWVFKSNVEVLFGLVFVDVANIYTDGCRWRKVDPQPGPTVDDLVSAYAKVPGAEAPRDVTVDGFQGKLIKYTVPDYNEDECQEGKFAIFREDGFAIDAPNLWAQVPNQRNEIRILDVGGTRLVIITSYPANTSVEDRSTLDAILGSVRIA